MASSSLVKAPGELMSSPECTQMRKQEKSSALGLWGRCFWARDFRHCQPWEFSALAVQRVILKDPILGEDRLSALDAPCGHGPELTGGRLGPAGQLIVQLEEEGL